MFQLIKTIVIILIVAVFAGFNSNNRCDVNLFFHTFKDVPVFFTIIFSFILGVIVAMPFVFVKRRPAKKNDTAPVTAAESEQPAATSATETEKKETSADGQK